MVSENANRFIEYEIRRVEQTPTFVATGLALKVAERAYAELEEQGLTQTRLAALMGVTRSHVSNLLTAPTNMTFLTFAKVALALGLTPDVQMYVNDNLSGSGAQPSRLEEETMAMTANDLRVSLHGAAGFNQRQLTDATT